MNHRLYSLGITLGGGGARGFAHLGVFQALWEAGIYPDIISGTSAGALIGVMIASGHAPMECLNFFKDKKILNFARPAMSRKGFMTLHSLEESLKEFVGVKTFEELKIPLVVTASDMNAARPVHFRQGELIPCVIASCTIPVVFVPQEINGNEYVDGGVFMNLPVRPIRPQCERIIAVEINAIDTSEKITNMVAMAIRAFHVGIGRNTEIDRSMADIVISPHNMTQYGIFDVENMQQIFEEGYRTTREILSRLNEPKTTG